MGRIPIRPTVVATAYPLQYFPTHFQYLAYSTALFLRNAVEYAFTTNCDECAAQYCNLPTQITTKRIDGAFLALQIPSGEIQYMNELW